MYGSGLRPPSRVAVEGQLEPWLGSAAQLATLPTHVWGSSASILQHACISETQNCMETESRLAGARNQ